MKCIQCGEDEENCSGIILNAHLKGYPICCFCADEDPAGLCDICRDKLEFMQAYLAGKNCVIIKEKKEFKKNRNPLTKEEIQSILQNMIDEAI